jgi:Modifier of rudimentary (Mod(r)) protein
MDKYSRQDLQHLLDTSDLLDSVYETTHPQAQHNLQALTETWTTNRSIAGPYIRRPRQQGRLTLCAERILTREEEVRQARKAAEGKLAEAKDLEAQWQAKQAEMDAALKVNPGDSAAPCQESRLTRGQPFSPPALYAKLETLVTETEVLSETLATSFLEGEEGDVSDFIREYRALRKQYHIRRERKEKWQNGQIAGWR